MGYQCKKKRTNTTIIYTKHQVVISVSLIVLIIIYCHVAIIMQPLHILLQINERSTFYLLMILIH